MKATVKRQWLKALRSGEYQQGQGQLRSDEGDRYCCLGVLCDLAVKAGVVGCRHDPRLGYMYGPYPLGASSAFLPQEVVKWAGLDTHSPEIPGHSTLSTLNDDGHSFLEIAALIEAHL